MLPRPCSQNTPFPYQTYPRVFSQRYFDIASHHTCHSWLHTARTYHGTHHCIINTSRMQETGPTEMFSLVWCHLHTHIHTLALFTHMFFGKNWHALSHVLWQKLTCPCTFANIAINYRTLPSFASATTHVHVRMYVSTIGNMALAIAVCVCVRVRVCMCCVCVCVCVLDGLLAPGKELAGALAD